MTVKELYNYCKEAIANGNGDKTILLSDDEEGNGFHEMYYAFTGINKYFAVDKDIDKEQLIAWGFPSDTTNKTHIILG